MHAQNNCVNTRRSLLHAFRPATEFFLQEDLESGLTKGKSRSSPA